jgi:hypothetical protein
MFTFISPHLYHRLHPNLVLILDQIRNPIPLGPTLIHLSITILHWLAAKRAKARIFVFMEPVGDAFRAELVSTPAILNVIASFQPLIADRKVTSNFRDIGREIDVRE